MAVSHSSFNDVWVHIHGIVSNNSGSLRFIMI